MKTPKEHRLPRFVLTWLSPGDEDYLEALTEVQILKKLADDFGYGLIKPGTVKPRPVKAAPPLAARELASVLCALRLLQVVLGQTGGALADALQDIRDAGETLEPLSLGEIDTLCERLNC